MNFGICRVSDNVLFRPCCENDLEKLEWFGQFYEHREIIQRVFLSHLKGSNFFLVAEFNHFPIGQLWINFEKKKESTGIIWAFRVLDPFQGLEIGKNMLHVAEDLIFEKGLFRSELSVEKTNYNAIKFYERNGYTTVGDEVDEYSYTNRYGQVVNYVSDQWVMEKHLHTHIKDKTALISNKKSTV